MSDETWRATEVVFTQGGVTTACDVDEVRTAVDAALNRSNARSIFNLITRWPKWSRSHSIVADPDCDLTLFLFSPNPEAVMTKANGEHHPQDCNFHGQYHRKLIHFRQWRVVKKLKQARKRAVRTG